MSPEQHPATPENNNEKPYLSKAQEVIAEAAMNAPETDARFEVIDTYVADVLEAAAAGEITKSRGGAYSKEEMIFQFEDFLTNSKKTEEERKGVDPFAYIPSAGGLRESFRLLMDNDATRRDFEQSLALHNPEVQAEARAELLTAEKVQEIGGAGLSAAEVQKPSAETESPKITKEEYLQVLTDGFSAEDVRVLDDYALSKSAQNRAAANGEYDNVAHWKREAYKDFKRLSEDARKIADQYAHAVNYY